MPKIILLSGKGKLEDFFYNALNDSYGIEKVIVEESNDSRKLLKRRIKKLGLANVFGQYLFSAFVSPLLSISSIKRIRQIIRENSLDSTPIPPEKKILVKSVNDENTIKLIQSIAPDIIIVNSTGIIKKKFIESVKCLILNIHCGITPMYKGYSGGYWALVKKDREHCGSTIHILDEGIDTGPILHQGTITVSKKDNYATYDFLHLVTEIGLLRKSIQDAITGDFRSVPGNRKNSERYYGPTIWGYFYNRLVNKVK